MPPDAFQKKIAPLGDRALDGLLKHRESVDPQTCCGGPVDVQEQHPAISRADRQALLDEIERRFGVKLLWYENMSSPSYRADVTTHGFFDPEAKLTGDLRQDIRRWAESQGWQFSRQMPKHPTVADRRIEYTYLAPMIPVALEVGYHATRRASVVSIMQHGLLPSVPERQTTENRWDCEGNIYLCERLGTPADAGVRGSGSAHWWRAELAQKNRFNDTDWVILRVEAGRLAGARTYRDIWSQFGVILDNVPQIPPGLIRLEYPTA